MRRQTSVSEHVQEGLIIVDQGTPLRSARQGNIHLYLHSQNKDTEYEHLSKFHDLTDHAHCSKDEAFALEDTKRVLGMRLRMIARLVVLRSRGPVRLDPFCLQHELS